MFFDVEQNIYELKFKNEINKIELNFKVNIKDIDGINNDMKSKGLFNFDFPYFIKNSWMNKFLQKIYIFICYFYKKSQ